MNTFFRNTLGLSLLALATTGANAQNFLVGNIPNAGAPSVNNAFDNPLGVGIGGRSQAVGFQMGAWSGDITSIQVALFHNGSATSARVSIYTGATEPVAGTQIGSFTTADTLTGSPATLTYTPVGTVTLTAGANYWLVVDNAAGAGFSQVTWAREGAGDGGGQPVVGRTVVNELQNSNDDWTGTTTDPSGTRMPNFAIYSTVPEPHEYALVAGLGLCGFAAYRRRSQRATASVA